MSQTNQLFQKNIISKISQKYPNICTVLPDYEHGQYQDQEAQAIEYPVIQNGQLRKLAQIPVKSLLNEPLFQKLKQNLILFVKILEQNSYTFQRIVEYEDETPISTTQSLKKQIQQASYTVDCKSRLTEYLSVHSSSIFSLYPPLYQFPHKVHTIRAGTHSLLTLQQYTALHEQTMQILLVRINTPSELKNFNYTFLEEKMRSLAMYVLKRKNLLRKNIFEREKQEREMHQSLLKSVMRNYYVCFNLKEETTTLEKKIDEHSLNKDVIEGVVKRIEQIQKYITQEQEQIFKKLYPRKLTKRMVLLENCREYAKKISSKKKNIVYFEKSDQLKNQLGNIKQKLANVPKNDQEFNNMFEDIQNALILSSQSFAQSGINAEQTLVNFQKILLSNYLLEKDGKRKQNVLRNSLTQSQFSKMRSSIKSKQQRIINNNNNNNNNNQLFKFISSLNLQYANQLNDQINFDISSLTNLLSSFPQSQESQNLKYFLQFLSPNISQQGIKNSLLPLSKDFLFLCNQLIQLQDKLSNIQLPSSLDPRIKQFMTTRQNVLSTLIRSLPPFTKIYSTLLNTLSKDLFAQSAQTAKIVLTSLLAQKQLDAYMQETVDGDKDASISGLSILKECLFQPLRQYVHESLCTEGQSLAVLLDNVEFFAQYVDRVEGVIRNIFEKVKKCKKREDVRKMYLVESNQVGGLLVQGRERLRIQPCRSINYQGVEGRIAVLADIDYVGKEGEKAIQMSSQRGKEFRNLFMGKK